jgi:hypothetical protein
MTGDPPPQTSQTTFKRGDRVKLSEFGKSSSPHARVEFGVVVVVPKGGRSVWVLFDGNKRPTPVHRSYIEPA